MIKLKNIPHHRLKVNNKGVAFAGPLRYIFLFLTVVSDHWRLVSRMPIMTRMRDNMPLILFLLLIAFLITIVFEWGMDYLGLSGRRSDEIGAVNGMVITGKEFSEVLRNYTQMQKSQSGADLTDDQLKQLQDQVWEALVTQRLLADEAERMGLSIADQEIRDWVFSDSPPEELKRMFTDSTGQFQRAFMERFLSNPNEVLRDPEGHDPNYGSRQLAEYEKGLRERRLQEKLQSIVLAGVSVAESEVRQRFIDQTEQFNARYAMFDADIFVKDSDVTVTDDDLRRYYDENLERYRTEATRSVNVILFPLKPSASDTALRRDEILDVAAKARSGLDFTELTATYTGKPDSGAWFKRGELSARVEDSAFSARVGTVVGPIEENDGLRVVKVLDERPSTGVTMRASHILFRLEGDTNQVKALARQVAAEARAGKDFADLAGQHSKDPGSAQRGGDLGWFAKGRMTPAFETAVFGAAPGQVVGPVRTPFGLHVIKVTGREAREVKLATVMIPIETSSQTRADMFERARDFAYNARKNDFGKEAEALGMRVLDGPVQQKAAVIPGIGVDQPITRWVFNNGVGEISEPFTVNAGYSVVTVAEVKNEGIRPFDEVRENLRQPTLRQMKIARTMQIAAELRAKLADGDSLGRIAQFNPSITVRETGTFSLIGGIPGVGRDMSFQGALLGLAVGQISPPVESMRGAYLIQLVSASGFDSTRYAAERENLRGRVYQEKKSRHMADWLQQLRAQAEIEDHRDLYSF